jgi:hypothetical protein
MDRRGFFKTLIATPFLTPFLFTSESTTGALQLYVIADSPHLFLPSILRGLNEYDLIPGQTFTLLNLHPEGKELKTALALSGWAGISKAARADLTISFSPLQQKASPSFTLIKGGKVWDIRSRKLSTLWKEMYIHHSPSSWLTTVSFREKNAQPQPGHYASVYIHGKKVERFWLKKNAVLSFPSEKGKINVAVKNGQAWVTASSCRHKICLSTPPVSFAGERIICAPNRFLLAVQPSSFVDTVVG